MNWPRPKLDWCWHNRDMTDILSHKLARLDFLKKLCVFAQKCSTSSHLVHEFGRKQGKFDWHGIHMSWTDTVLPCMWGNKTTLPKKCESMIVMRTAHTCTYNLCACIKFPFWPWTSHSSHPGIWCLSNCPSVHPSVLPSQNLLGCERIL